MYRKNAALYRADLHDIDIVHRRVRNVRSLTLFHFLYSMTSSEDSEKSLGKEKQCKRLAKSSLPYVRDILFLLCGKIFCNYNRTNGSEPWGS